MTRTYKPSWRTPSPGDIDKEMRQTKLLARRVAELADRIIKGYAELEDAAHSASSGEGVPLGKNGFRVSDPTGDIATSGMHSFMRAKIRHAASKLRKIEEPLQEAERILDEAFSSTDSDYSEQLKYLRRKELEATAESYHHKR